MSGRIIIVEGFEEQNALLEGVLTSLQERGLKAYFADPTFGITPPSESILPLDSKTSKRSAEEDIIIRLLQQKALLEDELRKYRILYSVASLLNQSLELETLLQTCLDRMMEALTVDSGELFLWGPQSDFRHWNLRNPDSRFQELILPLKEDPTILERIMHKGEVVVIDDLAEVSFLNKTLLAELGLHSFAIGPLRTKNRIMGAVILARKVTYGFTEADQGLILSVGGQIGMALEAGELYSELNNTVNELRQTNSKLEEATRHKSEFLANMSHELRTPLNAIIGFSEILQDQMFGPLNEKQVRYVSNILTSGKSLLALVNDILDLSKVEAGKMELSIEEMDLVEAINEVLGIIMIMAQKKHIGLSLQSTRLTYQIKADRTKFKQILYNLLSNAVKFTPDGGMVDVQAHKSGNFIEVSVIDNGIGIHPEDHQRIFEEFRMLDNVLTKKQQGTGLGLALSRQLAQLHGGTIRVQSLFGQGSKFTVSLPFITSSQQGLPTTELEPRRKAWGKETALSKNQKPGEKWALVVEDDDKSAELLQLYLEQNGYRVSRAITGEAALTLAKALKPSVISLDIILPIKSGWEVLHELKTDPDTRDIPVIVVSMADNRKVSVELGAVACFVKPVRREELASKLKEVQLDELRRRRHNHLKEHVQHGEPLHALIIDDSPNDRELITTVLSGAGLTVATAPNGQLGWEMAQRNPPDLVVLDLMMPELDGFEILTRLRQNAATFDIPVLICTAKELDSQEHKRLDHEAEAVLQKGDFSRQTLLETVNRLTLQNE
ncbi:MAG: response regulator [Chloroflexota bacterium]|nr:response regulator [Chloroflexota bacterium]